MATTFEQVARQVVAAIDSDATYLLAFEWIKHRYEQLAVRTKLKHLRTIGSLSIAGALDTGTVSITRGTRTLTADADATAVLSASIIGRHVRVRTVWYEILDYAVVGGFGVLTLATDFNEDSVTDGSYRIVQRFAALAADVGHLGNTFINPRRRWAIDLADYTLLDRRAPSRPQVGGSAMVVAEVPFDHGGVRRVELYPYSSDSETYYYTYWRRVADVKLDDLVPDVLPVYGLIEGALIDLFRYKMGKAIDAGKHEASATWRNEMRTQETKWQHYLVEMISADRGEDDAQFVLSRVGGGLEPHDIRTARDHVLAGWDWTA